MPGTATDSADPTNPEGLTLGTLVPWLEQHLPAFPPPYRFTLVAGGRSNLTYRVTSGSSEFVLRRPPTSHVLPTAHDMAREHRVIAALGPTSVPVPRALAYCDDTNVTGARFYCMSYVDGHILRDADSASLLDEKARRRAGESLVEVLASLHDVDPDAVGLGDLGPRDGYLERQLRRWQAQYERSSATGAAHGLDAVPAVEVAHARLVDAAPPQADTTIVHGDYRLDNAVVAPSGDILAVLDWEICTLGDPLADIGLLMVYWAEPGELDPVLGVAPTVLPGFPSRSELRDLYGSRSGRDLASLDYYIAFGYWKLACILQGVVSRYLGGAGAGDRSDIGVFVTQVKKLAGRALDLLS